MPGTWCMSCEEHCSTLLDVCPKGLQFEFSKMRAELGHSMNMLSGLERSVMEPIWAYFILPMLNFIRSICVARDEKLVMRFNGEM